MGQSVSSALAKAKKAQDEAAKRLQEDLKTMSAILNAKEEAFKSQLITPNGASKTIPIDTIVKMEASKSVDVSTAPSDKMKNMIEDLFGGKFLAALQGLVLGALDTVLGSATAGEKEKAGMTVILLHSAVVRVDYYVYAYTMRSDGIATELQNGLVFAVTLSTVRLANVNSEVIALLAGQTAEQQLSFVNRVSRKLETMSGNIASNAKFYPTNQAIGLIRGYFGDSLAEEQEEDIRSVSGADTEDAQEKMNKLLLELTSQHSVERSTVRQIEQGQEELLDSMIRIYDKISQMKLATTKAIAEGEKAALGAGFGRS